MVSDISPITQGFDLKPTCCGTLLVIIKVQLEKCPQRRYKVKALSSVWKLLFHKISEFWDAGIRLNWEREKRPVAFQIYGLGWRAFLWSATSKGPLSLLLLQLWLSLNWTVFRFSSSLMHQKLNIAVGLSPIFSFCTFRTFLWKIFFTVLGQN